MGRLAVKLLVNSHNAADLLAWGLVAVIVALVVHALWRGAAGLRAWRLARRLAWMEGNREMARAAGYTFRGDVRGAQ